MMWSCIPSLHSWDGAAEVPLSWLFHLVLYGKMHLQRAVGNLQDKANRIEGWLPSSPGQAISSCALVGSMVQPLDL